MKKIFFTGASGKAGKHVAKYLVDKGYKVLNVDKSNFEQVGLDYLDLDIMNAGQVYSAMSGYSSISELRENAAPKKFDAVIHFAAVPRILMKSDNETFKINTLGTYNVIEAAIKLGIKKIIFASSETTYGFCFSHGTPMPEILPIEEDSPLKPMDSYALSKIVNEQTAEVFQRKTGIDIYGLRIGNVIEPTEYEKFKNFCEFPQLRLPNVFNYIDARDLGQAVELCIKKDNLGFEIFNVSNDTNSVNLTNKQIIETFYPGVHLKRELDDFECLFSNRKIKSMLGFKPKFNWKNQI